MPRSVGLFRFAIEADYRRPGTPGPDRATRAVVFWGAMQAVEEVDGSRDANIAARDADGLGRLLREPSWGHREVGGGVRRPSLAMCLRETLRNVNVLASRRNLVPLLMFIGFAACGPPQVIVYLGWFAAPQALAVAALYFYVYTAVTNTIWWHRFACHRAFSTRSRALKTAFRWLSPVFVPLESYVVPHLVHHARPDQPGDPYTPLSGYAGCMFTEWTTGLLDADGMSADDFARARRMIEHTGVPLNDLERFRRWGTLQTLPSLLGDLAAAISLHWSVLYALGGPSWILAANTGLFIGHFLNLDFNYTAHGSGRAGHRDGVDFHRNDLSLNQVAPGWIGGEWHNNHHLFPGSMRTGFLPWQVDVPFQVVRLLHHTGLVDAYHDDLDRFRARCGL
jgi:stearoyl-CoA desaturase (delta-9 desaturase)